MATDCPILLVDDNDIDLVALEDLVRRANVANPVQLFRSGEAVVEHLANVCRHAECGLRALMLLDVRMPRMSGFDVLKWVRAQPLLSDLVVVMMSHIDEAADALLAVELGAPTYLHKYPLPTSLAALAKLVEGNGG